VQKGVTLIFKKEYRNIYLVGAIIIAAFIFMAVSTWHIFNDISGQTSADLAIDRAVDKCWEDNNLDK
jgi:hypothetical protein